jgi:hypothetical protein
MNVALCINLDPLYVNTNTLRRNSQLHNALVDGLRHHGDKIISYNTKEINCSPMEDVRIIIGNRDKKQCVDGIHRFVLDKGYDRRSLEKHTWLHWSIRYMPEWPETRLMFNAPHDRMDTMSMRLHARRPPGKTIVVATSSQNYCHHHDLGNANEYAEDIVTQLKKNTTREIWYRPKPTYKEAIPIKGTRFNQGKGLKALKKIFESAHLLITDGSHIGSRAVIEGIPSITLDGGLAYSVTQHTLHNLEDPYWPSEKRRLDWFADIGYSHYTIPEITRGLAWEVMKQKLK